MSPLSGKFVWFEHVSADVAKAQAFYAPLFNWQVETMPMGGQSYPMIKNGSQGIGGFRAAQPGQHSHWASFLSVADVDASLAAAVAAGAKTLTPPVDFGAIGRGAELADPNGAVLWLWHSPGGDRPDAATTSSGDWYWNELWTPDTKQSLAFYEKVFGYSHDSMDMGAQGTYILLKSGDQMRGGMFQTTDPKMPPQWLPYVRVDDCDASVAKAQTLGAKAPMPPTDMAGVGRLAVLIDPLGAAIAIIRPAPPSVT